MKCPECLSPMRETGKPVVASIDDAGNGVILTTPYECLNCDVKVAYSQAYKATSRPHTYTVEG